MRLSKLREFVDACEGAPADTEVVVGSINPVVGIGKGFSSSISGFAFERVYAEWNLGWVEGHG